MGKSEDEINLLDTNGDVDDNRYVSDELFVVSSFLFFWSLSSSAIVDICVCMYI